GGCGSHNTSDPTVSHLGDTHTAEPRHDFAKATAHYASGHNSFTGFQERRNAVAATVAGEDDAFTESRQPHRGDSQSIHCQRHLLKAFSRGLRLTVNHGDDFFQTL